MGTLDHRQSGRLVTLEPEHLIGRGHRAQLRLRHGWVSTTHAVLSWTSSGWRVRDLASRNGTWVNGRRIEAGQPVPLTEGDELAFGRPSEAWLLRCALPPGVFARALIMDEPRTGSGEDRGGGEHGEAGQVRLLRDGLLALPDHDDPVWVVHRAGDLWVAEGVDEVLTVQDGDVLPAGGRSWRLSLPGEGAWSTRASPEEGLAMRFRVSLDEEHVDVEVEVGGTRHELPPRAHHHLLLHLARQRLADADQPAIPREEQGWIAQDDLVHGLRTSFAALYQHIHRARRELAALGVEDAPRLVERRRLAGQIRIGLDRIHVRRG